MSRDRRDLPAYRGGASRFAGVSRSSDGRRWVARFLGRDGLEHLGTFDDEEDAARAFDCAKRAIDPESRYRNFPQEAHELPAVREDGGGQ